MSLILSPAQCRAARALLKWSQAELADVSKVARATLAEFEAERRKPYGRTLADVRRALEAAGVEFIGESDDRAGVRLRPHDD